MKRIISYILFLLTLQGVMAQESNITIEWPSEGYHTMQGVYMVPLDTIIHFKASSTSPAEQWSWTLEGATPPTVDSQEAAITYAEEGVYDIGVDAVVSGHQDGLHIAKGLQAGGANFVWNIAPEEESQLSTIALAWFGFYAGTNWLNMEKFAEYFHGPMQTAYIDSVAVRFGNFESATAGAELTMTIARADAEGMPGEALAATSIMAADIVKSTVNPTYFRFSQPVQVDGPFFVVIEGFPNGYGDEIAIQCLRRPVGEPCTAYHLLADEDENYQPTGTYTWYQNVDDPTSLAISPWLRYDESTGICQQLLAGSAKVEFDGRLLHLPEGASSLDVLTTGGTVMLHADTPSQTVSLETLPSGVYLVRVDGTTHKIMKR